MDCQIGMMGWELSTTKSAHTSEEELWWASVWEWLSVIASELLWTKSKDEEGEIAGNEDKVETGVETNLNECEWITKGKNILIKLNISTHKNMMCIEIIKFIALLSIWIPTEYTTSTSRIKFISFMTICSNVTKTSNDS